ncbi:hypothetical protein ECAE60S_03824 [Eoetvoesiella caeni]
MQPVSICNEQTVTSELYIAEIHFHIAENPGFISV